MTLARPFLPLLAALSLAACAVGPDYETPTIALPAAFAEGASMPTRDHVAERWWLALEDPQLTALVDRGLAQNLDIRTAVARVREAEANRRGTGGPEASGSLSASVTRNGGDLQPETTTETAGATGTLVLDLFGGRLRRQQEAQAQLDAAELDVGTARLAFLSSLVGGYIDARYYQEAAALARDSLETRRRTLDLVRQQRDAGQVGDLDLVRAQAAFDEAQAALPALETGFRSAVYSIATLLAEPATPLVAELSRGGAQPRPPGGGDAGVPAELLRNRPDIRAAERDLAAAVAALGVAEAQLYPALSLSGSVTATDPRSWSFGPTLTLPVLNRPSLLANRDAARARVEQAELAWRSAVLRAVEEVQRAQTALLRDRRTLEAQQAAAQSYDRLVDLSLVSFEAGGADLFDLLDAENSRAGARTSVAAALQTAANDWLALQVASGRGWASGPGS